VEFRVLGPLEVVAAGQPLGLGTPRQRALLGLLLVHAGEVVSYDRLVEDLTATHRPPPAIPCRVMSTGSAARWPRTRGG
jgi:hypothetical protein